MSTAGLATFCIAYLIAVATPGPGVAAVIARSLARGLQGVVPFVAGFLIGDLLWFAAAAGGLATLAHTARLAFVMVKYLGAAYLLYLSYRLWTSPAASLAPRAATREQNAWQLFMGSLTLTLGNPKTMIFFLALLPSVVPLEQLRLAGYGEVAMAIGLILPLTLGAYALIAARARRLLVSPRAVRALNRSSGTIMAAAAVAVATR
jgi:threonine/homoserine/homoserine lactone efflux protein